MFSVILFLETSVLFCNLCRIFARSSSCDERESRSNVFSEIFNVFIDQELLVTLTGGDVCNLEESSFSSWSKIFFIYVKSIILSIIWMNISFFSVFSLENEIFLHPIYVALYIFLIYYWIGKKLLKLVELPIYIGIKKTEITTLSSIRMKTKRVFSWVMEI